jgi:hypothetical protein
MAAFAALAGFPAVASAQNLDPTVVVSRNYEGKLMEVHKPKIEMAVPDSVLRFDLEFDYSVSDSPYKGAYDFRPYTLDMKPSPMLRELQTLYLNAGAGYGLHPEFDIIWTPALSSESFRMGVYAHNRSYFGEYHRVSCSEADGVLVLDSNGSGSWKGYDSRSSAGLQGRYDWDNAYLDVDLGYDGLHQKSVPGTRAYDAVAFKADVASKDAPYSLFNYDFDVAYRYGNECGGASHLAENHFKIDGNASYPLSDRDVIRLDLVYDLASYRGLFDAQAALLSVAPHYVMDFGRLDLDLGFSLASAFNAMNTDGMFSHKRMAMVPYLDMKAGYDLIPSYMKVSLALGGGMKMNPYSGLLAFDRWASYNPGMLDFTDEKFSSAIGLEGRISSVFSYAFKGGFASIANAPLHAIQTVGDSDAAYPLRSAVAYSSFDKAFAALEWRLDTERIMFDGNIEYAYVWNLEPLAGLDVFAPAALSGDVSFLYNWKKRIYAGLSCDYSTVRKGYGPAPQDVASGHVSELPGYADLGVDFRYAFSRKFSMWAKGGNLLNMTIQRTPGYAEKGPYFTLGISLNL